MLAPSIDDASGRSQVSLYVLVRTLHVGIGVCTISRKRPPEAKTLPISDEMDQIPATEALGGRRVSIRRLRKTCVIVVGHVYIYIIIYITSPSRYLKNRKNLLRTTPGSQNLALAITP